MNVQNLRQLFNHTIFYFDLHISILYLGDFITFHLGSNGKKSKGRHSTTEKKKKKRCNQALQRSKEQTVYGRSYMESVLMKKVKRKQSPFNLRHICKTKNHKSLPATFKNSLSLVASTSSRCLWINSNK